MCLVLEVFYRMFAWDFVAQSRCMAEKIRWQLWYSSSKHLLHHHIPSHTKQSILRVCHATHVVTLAHILSPPYVNA